MKLINNTTARKLLTKNNINSKFELVEMTARCGNKRIQTGEFAVIDTINNRFVRACKSNYHILQNDVFVESVLDAMDSMTFKSEINGIDIFKQNDGIMTFVDSKMKIEGSASKFFTSIDLVVVDGITQQSSLGGGIKINLNNGAYVLYFPESCKANKRNIKDKVLRVSYTRGVLNETLNSAKEFLDNFNELSRNLPTNSIDGFISVLYGENENNSAKLESAIVDLKSTIEMNRTIAPSFGSAIFSLFDFLHSNATKSRDREVSQYFYLSKGKTDLDYIFEKFFVDMTKAKRSKIIKNILDY